MKKISVITATFNSAKTVQTCFDSVLNQTYPHIEYIIIDGGSKDETVNIIKKNADKNPNIVWVSEKDNGIYDALNKGIAMATGEIVGFVHSDDYLASDDILKDIAAAFESKEIDGVYGDLHYVDFLDVSKVIRNWKSQDFKPSLLKRGWMPAHPTLFLKSQLYQKEGVFNTKFKIAADYDFILRIFKNPNYSFEYLPKTIVKMRVGGASNKSFKNLVLKTHEDLKVAKSNGLPLPYFTIGLKNISKIPQWIKK